MAQELKSVAIEQQNQNAGGAGIYGQRYAETRAPQFVGGDLDTVTGNVIPSSKAQAAAAPDQSTLTPATPTTQLGQIEPPAAPSTSGPSTASVLGGLATTLGTQALSKTLGDTLSKGVNALFGGTPGAAGKSPLDSAPPGGGVDNTGAGGGGYGGTSPTPDIFSPTPATYNTLADPYATTAPAGGGGLDLSPAATAAATAPAATPGPVTNYGGPGDTGGVNFSVGTVICTELHRQGKLDGITFEADQRFGAAVQAHHPWVYDGYIAWAVYVVALMQKSARATAVVQMFATPWAQHLACQMGERDDAPLFGALIHKIGWRICWSIGATRAFWRFCRGVTAPVSQLKRI